MDVHYHYHTLRDGLCKYEKLAYQCVCESVCDESETRHIC